MSPPAPGSAGSDALLDALLTVVDHLSLARGAHVAVGAALDEDAGDVVLAVRFLDDHPCTELAEFTAPEEWEFFGLGVLGIGYRLDIDGPSRGVGEPMRAVMVLDRTHRGRSALHRLDLPPSRSDDLGEGEVVDLCRRVLPRRAA